MSVTSIQHQTLYQQQIEPNIGPSASFCSSSSEPTVYPIHPSFVITQNYTVSFVAMNKSVKTYKRLLEEILNQIDAHMIFAMEKQPLDPPAYV